MYVFDKKHDVSGKVGKVLLTGFNKVTGMEYTLAGVYVCMYVCMYLIRSMT